MKKILFFLLIIIFLFNSIDIMESISFSFSLCIKNLFPSLIPFLLLSNILISYDFHNEIGNTLNKIIEKTLRVNKNCSFAIVMSIISGSPSNGRYLLDLLDNNLINEEDCQKCLNFCHYISPIFIIGTIGYSFLNNKMLGLIVLISHYVSSIIIGIIYRNKKSSKNKIKYIRENKNTSFINALTCSIKSTIDTLLLILGIITTCLIITTLLNNILCLNNDFKFLYGLIEITQGLKYLSMSNINVHLKTILCSFLASFGGICIHMQVFSILNNKKIRYYPYFVSRILHGLLASVIAFIIIKSFI